MEDKFRCSEETESRREIKENEQKYQTVLKTCPDGFWLCSSEGILLDANDAYCRMSGYAKEHLVGMPISRLDALKSAAEIASCIEETRIHGSSVFESVHRRKDGSLFNVEVSTTYLPEPNKEFYTFIRDITERKQADERLQEQKRFFEQMFSQSSVSTQILDKDGWCERINSKLSEIFGVKPEDIEGRVYNIFKDEELRREGILPLLEKVFYEGKTAEWDILFDIGVAAESQHIEVREKKSVWYHNWAFPIFDDKGRISHVIIQHTDISERKQAEEALLLYKTAIQTAANAILITDRKGTIISVNHAFTQMTGYEQEEVIGKRPSLLKSENQTRRYFENLWETISAGRVWKGELENKRKDGSLITVQMTITPVRQSGGEISHYITIKEDVTEQKKLQNQLFQAQKVQSIGTLAGGIAHDFNNILGIILGYTTMLEARRADPVKHDESIAVITKTVERGAAIVQQILTFARKTDVLFEPLNISEFVRDMIRMLEEMFPKTIIFREIYAPNLPNILGDRTQLHQTLLNLCVNARDAMPAGGVITIAVDRCVQEQIRAQFPEASEETYLSIKVSDTGEGMDEATRLRVFDPFFTTKEKGKGTGLGLSVVYGVVQAHHGFVDVESRKGEGTSFSLFLPILKQREERAEQVKQAATEIRGGAETILVVEDEDFLMNIICMFLEAKGYHSIMARDGQEAVELYTRHHDVIGAVLSDIGLPKLSGFDEFKKLKEIDPDVKVILASGFFEPAIKDELQRAGVKGFINKPYRPDDVLRMIRDVLDAQ